MPPVVVDEWQNREYVFDLYSRMLRDRIIVLDTPIEDWTATMIVGQMLFLEEMNPREEIALYINSPGGVISGAAIGDMVLVKDASADSTVDSGAALYVYQDDTAKWVKVAEYESMDVTINWADVQGKKVDFAVIEHGAAMPDDLSSTGLVFEKAAV